MLLDRVHSWCDKWHHADTLLGHLCDFIHSQKTTLDSLVKIHCKQTIQKRCNYIKCGLSVHILFWGHCTSSEIVLICFYVPPSVLRTGVHADARANVDRTRKRVFNDSMAVCICFKMCLSDLRGLLWEWNSSVVFVQKGNATAVLFPWSTAHLYILTHMLCNVHSRNVDAISYPASYLYQSLWPSAQGTIIPGHSAFGMLVTVALVGEGCC